MLNKLAELLFPGEDAAAATPENRTALATCVILLEAACSDQNFTVDEREHIVGVLRQRFQLSDDEATELLEEANEERNQSTDLFRFTTQLNQSLSHEEKIGIIEEVWRVIYSDGVLDAHEDHLVHKLRALLNLNQPQLIKAKMKVLKEQKPDEA